MTDDRDFVLVPRDGRPVADVDAEIMQEFGIDASTLAIMKGLAAAVGVERIPTLPSQQIEAEVEILLRDSQP